MPTVMFNHLVNGSADLALRSFMDTYIGYGMMWMFFAVVLASAVFAKTRSYGITGMVFLSYLIVLTSAGVAIPPEISQYFLLIIGFFTAVMAIMIYMQRSS